MRILATGGCGFIGSHFVHQALDRVDVECVVNLDALTYSGHLGNLEGLSEDERYLFIHASINEKEGFQEILSEHEIDLVVHLAAESHVDRSIDSVEPFVKTNVDGTRSVLEAIHNLRKKGTDIRLVHVSTDEVYGSLGPNDPPFTEATSLDPRNPYASTKAASDLLVRAFSHTHNLPAVITRCSNNYGPNQFPEKLIPLMTLNALEGKSLPVYGDGMQIRDWIHVSDHVDGILTLCEAIMDDNIEFGEVFNMGADNEIPNIEIVHKIIELTGASKEQIEHVRDRPGHDRRYAMGFEKMAHRFSWSPKTAWKHGIEETVSWYQERTDWVDSVRTGAYREWIDTHYR